MTVKGSMLPESCKVRQENTFRYTLGIMTRLWMGLLCAAFACSAGPIIFDALGSLNQVLPGPGLTVGGGILRGDPPGHQGATYAEAFPGTPTAILDSIELFVQYISIPGLASRPPNLDV